MLVSVLPECAWMLHQFKSFQQDFQAMEFFNLVRCLCGVGRFRAVVRFAAPVLGPLVSSTCLLSVGFSVLIAGSIIPECAWMLHQLSSSQ